MLVERTIHQALAAHRVRGEWFDADWDHIKALLFAVSAAGRVLREKHALELKRERIAWELANPDWQEIGEDNMRIDATIHGRHDMATP